MPKTDPEKLAYGAAYYLANREAVQAQHRAYYLANRERVLAKQAAQRVENPDVVRARGRKHYAKNKEEINAKHALWRAANKNKIRNQPSANPVYRKTYAKLHRKEITDEMRAKKRQYALNNKERLAEARKVWLAKNPGKLNSYYSKYQKSIKGKIRAAGHNAKHRARLRNVGSDFTREDWIALVSASSRCHWCKRPFNKNRKATHDHVIALSRGGANTIANSVAACDGCNKRKQNKRLNPVTGEAILI